MSERSGETAGLSKTLDAGLRVLELLATHPDGLTITEVADGIGVHRTVAHRFVRTLEAHRLVRRDKDRRYHLGAGLVPLAEPVERDLRALALPLLEELADEVAATAHLVVQEGAEHVRALLVVEPRRADVHVAFRAGQLDSIDRGSAGMAILAALPEQDGERPEVTRARAQGYAVSFSEVVPSVHGVSAPVPALRDGAAMSVGVSVFDLAAEVELGRAVTSAAERLARALR
ncbi:IclR family transcriptional regulator [Nocardioides alkalitolerans]|uniref:IclR family transcriptional regulator n=1 Tax=Nocardioides alkalitolerans TaxID=281714 RepID=UPI0003FD940A|nr:helix-turn-helix domain-containing protein [Nocardioides alkalitolerans]